METGKRRSRKRKAFWFIGGLCVLLVAIRLILPYVILAVVNKKLGAMKGYYGHVQDLGLVLMRGTVRIDSIYLNKRDTITQKQTPFFAASQIDASVEKKSLMKGAIVGNLVFTAPMLRFTKDEVEPGDVIRDSIYLGALLDDFMPLQINRCEISMGRVQFIDNYAKPKVDIEMNRIHLLAQNLRNSYDSSTVLPATIKATASVYDGTLTFLARADPLQKAPMFDMSAELKNTNLVKLNEFFKAYARVDVNSGTFGLYTEVAARDGKFTGYVKPIINDLDVLGHEDRNDNLLRKIWEGVAGTVGEIFQNQQKDQLATRIQFQGNLRNPETNIWLAISNVLRNAFIQALRPSIDNEIDIGSVQVGNNDKKTILQKIFSRDDSGKKDEKQN